MTITDYSEKALTTAIYPNVGNNLAYPILGMIEETVEFAEKLDDFHMQENQSKADSDFDIKELTKEAGDIVWYANAIALECKTTLKAIMALSDSSLDFISHIATLAGKTKKFIRDDNGQLANDKCYSILLATKAIVASTLDTMARLGVSQETIFQTNIDKLFDRKDRGVLGGSGDNR